MSVPDYYNRVNLDLLHVIPPHARAVLEVGCGTGAMAEQFLAINPGTRYVGIEMNAEAAAIASTRLARVIVGNVETLDLADLGLEPESFDALVFGDVLEHMTDPWRVLGELARLLRPGGQALACIPNVQHWSVIVDLLRGRWEYQDEGLMDRTHLRFFAAESLRPMFSGAGLQVFDVRPRWWPGPEIEAFERMMAPVVQSLGLDPAQFALRTRAVQYVVRSVKSSEPPRPIAIQTLIGEPLVCARVRVMEPDRFLGTIPGVRTIAATDASLLGQVLPEEQKVFIRQRNILDDNFPANGQSTLVKLGYLVVCEFDDDPAHFLDGGDSRHLTFTASHAVQTSTETLAEILRPFTPHVKVFANQIAVLPPPRPPRAEGPVTLFFGALNREKDWAEILPALDRVLAERGDSVRVNVVYDQAFHDALSTPSKTFEPLCPYDRYTEILRSSDIALLPLGPTRFNACKSDLKFIECAAHGTVALASPTVYAGTIDPGKTGLIYEGPEDFEAKLHRLIDDAILRRTLADAAYRYVAENRMLAGHYRERYDWYAKLLSKKPMLDRELRQRVPELFV